MPPKYGGSTGWSTTNYAPPKFTPPPNKFAGYQPTKTGAEERAATSAKPTPVNATPSAAPVVTAYSTSKDATGGESKVSPTPAKPTPAPAKAAAAPAPAPAKAKSNRKPGSITFSGKRHEIIGFRKGEDAAADEPIVVKVNNHDETIYIDGCKGTNKDGSVVVKIEGKFNALTINNCERCGIVFDDGVAVCEIVNSKKLQVQVTGLMNNWQVDKSSEITLYISEASTENIHILSSQWEAVNVVVPVGDDMKEFGFPEQFKSQYCTSRKALVHDVFEASVSESM